MSDWRADFEQVLFNHLIPEFCSDPGRHCDLSGFRKASIKVTEQDARYFLMAWVSGLIEHQGRGLYRAANSAAGEQFFWTGRRAVEPRSFTLWIEPVITVAGLARLHFDYGWPIHLIGTQSIDWAFDLVTFLPEQQTEFIAGEVKKTSAEVKDLVGLMQFYGHEPRAIEPITSGKPRNAYKKIAALRARHAPLFWAVGPDGLSKVYRVEYSATGLVDLIATDDEALRFRTLPN